jgi:RHS repeat-associated protein
VDDQGTLSNGSTFYQYDGNGQRVAKARDTGLTIYVYDAFGKLTSEYTNFPMGVQPCTTCYLSQDHLGNTRLVTDQAGNTVARHDYRPFGDEITAGYGGRTADWAKYDSVKQKFTGQEHDGETQFDFFHARYLSGAQQRFMSADPGNAGADLLDPQSWNGYSYVGNNPLARIDPTGTSWLGDLWNGVSNFFNGGCGATFCVTGTGMADIDGSYGLLGWGLGGGSNSSAPSTPPPPPPPYKFTVTATANPPTNKTCPAVPPHPASADVNANAKDEKLLRLFLPPLKEALFYLDVRNGSKWDYKQQGQSVDDFGQWHSSPYQDFGNFNFGVVGAAAGIPQQELLRGAGFAQSRAKTSNPRFGRWYDLHPPYGDDPNDQAMIRAGYAYYENGCVQ